MADVPDKRDRGGDLRQYAIIPDHFSQAAVRADRADDAARNRHPFFAGLAQRNGFECYVQPQPQTGLDVGYFGPAMNFPDRGSGDQRAHGPETNVSEFQIRYDMARPTTAMWSGLDVKTLAPFTSPR